MHRRLYVRSSPGGQNRSFASPWSVLLFCWLAGWTSSALADVFISEVLFNPPGTNDVPNEFIELRGTPNEVLAIGSYFVVVEGDTNGNPGSVKDVFDLSGQPIGGNGFLVQRLPCRFRFRPRAAQARRTQPPFE